MSKKMKGLFAIHISVLLFGGSGIFAKLLELHPLVIVFGRVFFASLFLLFFCFFLRQSLKIKQKKDYLLFPFLGVILVIHWSTFFYSIQVSTVAIGVIAFSTFPIFTTFLEPLFFKEKLKLHDFILAFIAFIGVAFVMQNFDLNSNNTKGVLWGMLSGFSFSILSIFNRKYAQNYSSFVIAFYQDFWAMVVVIPFLFFFHPIFKTHDFLLLLLLGIVFTALAHSFFIKGMSVVRAQTASIIASLEPVYGIIFAVFLVQKIPPVNVLLGGLLILGVTFYATIKSLRESVS